MQFSKYILVSISVNTKHERENLDRFTSYSIFIFTIHNYIQIFIGEQTRKPVTLLFIPTGNTHELTIE